MQFGKSVESRLELKVRKFHESQFWDCGDIRAKPRSPLLQPPGPNKITTGSRNAICSTQLLLSPLIHQLLLQTQHNSTEVLYHTNCTLWSVLKLRDLTIQDPYFDHHNP